MWLGRQRRKETMLRFKDAERIELQEDRGVSVCLEARRLGGDRMTKCNSSRLEWQTSCSVPSQTGKGHTLFPSRIDSGLWVFMGRALSVDFCHISRILVAHGLFSEVSHLSGSEPDPVVA